MNLIKLKNAKEMSNGMRDISGRPLSDKEIQIVKKEVMNPTPKGGGLKKA